MLELNRVSKHFEGIRALDKCSFHVKEGEIAGLIGPNGSGKTTAFNTITGLYKASEGEIIFKGEDITDLRTNQIANMGIGRTFQMVRLFPKMTVMDNMLVSRRYIKAEKLWPQLFSKSHVRHEEDLARERCKEILKTVRLEKKIDELAETLSYGQQKLLEIARCLALEPELLLLDEPIAGVNPSLAKEILDVIRKLNKEGKTVVLIEHAMWAVMDICQRIIVLDYGKVIAEGMPSEIRKDESVIEAYLGKRDQHKPKQTDNLGI